MLPQQAAEEAQEIAALASKRVWHQPFFRLHRRVWNSKEVAAALALPQTWRFVPVNIRLDCRNIHG